MRLKAYRGILFLGFLVSGSLLAFDAIVPEKVMSQEEIQDVLTTGNFFLYRNMDEINPIWKKTNRQYGSHLLGKRTDYYDCDEVTHKVLTDGFPIRYTLEQLYRAKAGIHSALGNILPQVNLNVGEGAAQLGLMNVFTSLYNFLLPGNWLKLGSADVVYKSTQVLLAKTVLDQILAIKTLYINQHQLIAEFEIMNFYFIHLQLLARKYPQRSREIQTILGQFASQGADMALKRGELKLSFDTLEQAMALEKAGGTYSADAFNIRGIDHFPERVLDINELEEVLKDKETFLKEVVKNSLELEILDRFAQIAKLNIGIVASGGSLSTVNLGPANPHNDLRVAFSFGYGTLPNILTANSNYRTSKIDIQSGYIDMLTKARVSYDLYVNSLGGYTEAKRALMINRKAFKENLEYYNSHNKEPDAIFLFSLTQLIQSELRINLHLHGSLRAWASIERYLVRERTKALSYLPSKGETIAIFKKLKGDRIGDVKQFGLADYVFEKVRSASELQKILYDHTSNPFLKNLTEEEVVALVKMNIGNLLFTKFGHFKTHKFYKILATYIQEKNIRLTQFEQFTLERKQKSWFKRTFGRHKLRKDDYFYNFDFTNFGDLEESEDNKT